MEELVFFVLGIFVTSASAKQYLPGEFSTRCLTVSATLQSTLTGSQAPGAKNSLKIS